MFANLERMRFEADFGHANLTEVIGHLAHKHFSSGSLIAVFFCPLSGFTPQVIAIPKTTVVDISKF